MFPYERLVDDDVLLTWTTVGGIELPSLQERKPKDAKVVRRDRDGQYGPAALPSSGRPSTVTTLALPPEAGTVLASAAAAIGGTRAKSVEQGVVERRAFRDGRILRGGQRQRRRDDVGPIEDAVAGKARGVDAKVDREVGEQHHRQRDLRREEHGRPAPPPAERARTPAVLEDGDDVRPGGVNGRQQREEEDRQRRHADQRGEDPPVDGIVEPVGERVTRDGAAKGADAANRDQQADARARRRDGRALRQQLAYQPEAAAAHRRADGQLPRPQQRSIEHQVRDVRAGDQHHDEADRHEGEPDGIGRTAEESVVDRHHARARVPVGVRMLGRKALRDAGDFGNRVVDTRVVGDAAEDLERSLVAALRARPGACHNGSQIVAVPGKPERSGRIPISATGRSLTVIVRPSTAGSLP